MKKVKRICDICGDDVTELGIMSMVKCKVCGMEYCSYCIKIHQSECAKKHSVKEQSS
jgi:hypothetical protein